MPMQRLMSKVIAPLSERAQRSALPTVSLPLLLPAMYLCNMEQQHSKGQRALELCLSHRRQYM